MYPIFGLFINLLRSSNNPSEISIEDFANLNKYLVIVIGISGRKKIVGDANND